MKNLPKHELFSGINISTITESGIDTIETASVQFVPETKNSYCSDVTIESSDSHIQSSVPAADLTKPSFKDFGVLNVIKLQNKDCFSDTSGNYNNFYPII